MSSPEYVKKPKGMTLEELKECVEWLIRKKWWNQTKYLNQINIKNPPDKLYTYLDSGGRYYGITDSGQRYGNVREWHIRAKVTAKPTEPCLQVLNGIVTIVSGAPPTPIAVPTPPWFMYGPEYVKKPEGMTLEELKECVEWLIEKKWWNQTELLNTVNISNPPDKLYTYLDTGGRYHGHDTYAEIGWGHHGQIREWGIIVHVRTKPTEPCLQVLNGIVTIVNSPPPAPIAVPTNPPPAPIAVPTNSEKEGCVLMYMPQFRTFTLND
tara:strand:+ start:1272 stop:2069 length:798 start_codon:yes stop_codon:yes gene_type:complete